MYEGELDAEGQFCKNGDFTFPDGTMYKGSFLAGKRNGYGVYTSADGTRYSGLWKDYKKDGYGTEIFKDGTSYEGYW